MQDRFVKIMLVIVAGLLVANLVRSNNDTSPTRLFESNANAQSSRNNNSSTPVTYQLKNLKGVAVNDIKDAVAVGDGRSFVVTNSSGFMVYQVVPSR